MAYKAILFDLDGTLAPMDIQEFTKCYFGGLARVAAPYGVDKKQLIGAVLGGLEAMCKNDGSRTNSEAFWSVFSVALERADELIPVFDGYYKKEYYETRAVVGENPFAREAVQAAHEGGRKVVIATNPVFPMCAQEVRMSFVGLTPADFEFVTSYENDSFAKPNPQYYLSICERLGAEPSECLMIGNDEHEDMYAATAAGLDCFLVTDCIIEYPEHPWQGRKGTFKELVEFLKSI